MWCRSTREAQWLWRCLDFRSWWSEEHVTFLLRNTNMEILISRINTKTERIFSGNHLNEAVPFHNNYNPFTPIVAHPIHHKQLCHAPPTWRPGVLQTDKTATKPLQMCFFMLLTTRHATDYTHMLLLRSMLDRSVISCLERRWQNGVVYIKMTESMEFTRCLLELPKVKTTQIWLWKAIRWTKTWRPE